MSNPLPRGEQWNQWCSGPPEGSRTPEVPFRLWFERSLDAVVLIDPRRAALVDCNAAAVAQLRFPSKEQLLGTDPAALYPARQSDGRLATDTLKEAAAVVARTGGHRLEWLARRHDGTEVPLEVVLTALPATERSLVVAVARDLSPRQQTETQFRQLNAFLEQRVALRTAELAASEARLRTLVEYAPEAIVVLDADTGRFITCNDNATRLFGLSREQLMQVGPVETSPRVQPDGRLSADAARHWLQQALEGNAPAFEWMHRHSDGHLIPCEIRLVLLPGEGRRLIRASILDNTERQRRERVQQATYQISEAVHSAEDLPSFYARVHSIVQTLMPARNFYLALLDEATQTISFPYFVDEQADAWPAPRPIGTGLTGVVLRTGKPLLVSRNRAAQSKRIGNTLVLEGVDVPYVEAGTRAAIWLGVPLLSQGRPFGVMAVQDYHLESAYGETEKQILTFVAEQTELAIKRKAAEQALRESEEKFRALFEATSTGVMIHDEEKFIEVNPAAVRITGYERAEQIVGRHPREFAPPTQPDGEDSGIAAARHIAECLERGHTRFEWTNLSPAGELIPMEVILTRIEMGGRRVIQAVVTDIRERKKVEEELRVSAARLRESEARFRSAFYNSPIRTSIARVSDGRFIEVNDAFLEGLHLSRDEVIGKDSAELGIWVNPEERAAFWADLKTHGTIRHREVTLHNRLGARYTMLLSADIVEIRGEPHVLVNSLDITDRKRAEEELLRALAREKELSQLKSSFVSLVSHEFRTPLGIISSSSEILRDYLDDLPQAERRDHLDSIVRNTRRMSELMEEVLVLGRLDAGKMAFSPAPLDLAELCRRLVDEVLVATAHACRIELQLGALLSGGRGDERLLRHILTNLLANAVKYSELGRVVTLRVARDGREAVFIVRDQGIGIPEADQGRLFQAFQRGGNVGSRMGTGLGLVIVRRCLELHGGHVRVQSTVGVGTTVTVRLPLFESPA